LLPSVLMLYFLSPLYALFTIGINVFGLRIGFEDSKVAFVCQKSPFSGYLPDTASFCLASTADRDTKDGTVHNITL